MLANKLMSALSGGAEAKLYVDDVFSTYLYTGNGSTQTINNGIDLAGKGGLVWIKPRGAGDHQLFDTARGGAYRIQSHNTDAQGNLGVDGISFSASGFSPLSSYLSSNGVPYASWVFAKAPKFFDVVTYTGNGENTRDIQHALGTLPGMWFVKRTDSSSAWFVGGTRAGTVGLFENLRLNSTATGFNQQAGMTASTFRVFGGGYPFNHNVAGASYVAHLWANDASPEGLVQCGSYTGNGSNFGPVINLGWEPQFLLVKHVGASEAPGASVGNWQIIDSMRGMPVGSAAATLQANLSNSESSVDYISPTSTGFQITSMSSEVNTSGSSYIYLAIRRPNKPPTSGTEVYTPLTQVGNQDSVAGFNVDLALSKVRGYSKASVIATRLQGKDKLLFTSSTNSETNTTDVCKFDYQDRVRFTASLYETNTLGYKYSHHLFRRAPGFFDVVCYTGTGETRTMDHSLGVVPELIIWKTRSAAGGWWVYHASVGILYIAQLNTTNIFETSNATYNYTSPTISTFPCGKSVLNSNNVTYVAYLFATKAGISKVGSYTGNGTSQTINCGFTTGSRFILIKSTDSTGEWYIWDTARGIVSANDPHLSLNTTGAEVTTDDSVDPIASGFIVNQNTATNINVRGGQYIFLAIA